ncbi:DUF2617 family protein [Corynebacterium uterequi]|uniref:Uncharacterized protein n=1 Tax=Corynebacterium uterequi TaxID=1072256 RepID=A0A0G3HG39_9CORY|nr:DUF2617 family protein [Corynebacterium uterequi]AKK11700.1 Protein of unknown function DUF2617 [Corynebacterium uterequi]
MIQRLDITPVDTRPEQLKLSHEPADVEALASVEIEHPDFPGNFLRLAVIGASHIATVSGPEVTMTEEVSGRPRPKAIDLPEGAIGYMYDFTSAVKLFNEEAFAELVSRLSAWEDDGFSVVVEFPGDGPGHLTALRAAASIYGWSWETWHLYPAQRVAVETHSNQLFKHAFEPESGGQAGDEDR